MIDLQALKDELTNDPLGRGYSVMSDAVASESLNVQDRQPNRDDLDAGMLMSALVESEYDTLPARGKKYFDLLVAAGTIPLSQAIKSQLNTLFDGTVTKTNLLAAFKRPGSRADELDLGGTPTPSDVAEARNLP